MNKLFFRCKYFIKLLLRILFSLIGGGEKCVICGKGTFLNKICRNCISAHFCVEDAIISNRCSCCGKELLSTKETCFQCREKSIIVHADFVLPLFSYRLWNKELMFIWKTQEERTLSVVFAKLIAEAMRRIGAEFIVPVPPRPGKIQKKGWDQIDELCQFLEFMYDFKIVRLLERRSEQEQKKLSRNQRLSMIGKSYYLKEEKKLNEELKKNHGIIPKNVCLLDDVCTTGSTVENCAEVLKTAGVEYVQVVTLFVVD